MANRILIGLDDSPSARSALTFAIGYAREHQAELHLLCVVPLPEISGMIDEVKDARRTGQEKMGRVLRTARELAERANQPVVSEIRFGRIAETIQQYAAEHGADLIVVGKSRRQLASVSAHVAKHATCEVFVVSENEIAKYSGDAAGREEHWEIRKDTRERLHGRAKMIRIYVGADDKWQGQPLYEAVVRRLRAADVAGATVFRGMMGYGAQQRVHKTGAFRLSSDLPYTISAVDSAEKIAEVLPLIDEMVDEGLVVTSDVEVIKYTHTPPAAAETTPGPLKRRWDD